MVIIPGEICLNLFMLWQLIYGFNGVTRIQIVLEDLCFALRVFLRILWFTFLYSFEVKQG